MVKQQPAKAGEFLAASGSARATMQTAGDHVAMAGVLIADRRINDKDSAVQVPDSEYEVLGETRII